MITILLTKVLIILLVLSILNILRNVFLFTLSWFSEEERKEKVVLTSRNLLLLGLSIAYVVTILFTGVSL